MLYMPGDFFDRRSDACVSRARRRHLGALLSGPELPMNDGGWESIWSILGKGQARRRAQIQVGRQAGQILREVLRHGRVCLWTGLRDSRRRRSGCVPRQGLDNSQQDKQYDF